MDLFLKILGGLFLALLILLVAVALYVRYRLKKLGRFLSDLSTQMEASRTPARVTLVRVVSADVSDGICGNAASTLADLGFRPAGVFDFVELSGVRLAAWASPRDGMYAVAYRYPQASDWIDLVTYYADGTTQTHSNAAQGALLDQRPGHAKSYRANLGAAELYRWALDDRPNKPTRSLTPEQFAQDFEAYYADEMAWRAARGGVTEDEVRAIVAASGADVNDEIIQAVREVARGGAKEAVEEELLDSYKESTTLSVKRWETVAGRLVFVHDHMARDDVFDVFESWDVEDVDDEVLDALPDDLPARATFERVNNALPAGRRFEKLDIVRSPIEADVYVAPVVGADE